MNWAPSFRNSPCAYLPCLCLIFLISEELKRVNLEDSPEEINVVAFDENDRKYPMPPNDEFDADVLREFVEDVLAGTLLSWERKNMRYFITGLANYLILCLSTEGTNRFC